MADLSTQITAFVGELSFRDVIDIAVVSALIYGLLLFFKGTRAMQMLGGLAMLLGLYLVAEWAGLVTTQWLFSNFISSLIVILVVLFQHEIRPLLIRMGKASLWHPVAFTEKEAIEEVTRAVRALAQDRIGALIVFQRETGLNNFLDTGTVIDARVRRELIVSLFHPSSPIHDGAVIIVEGRVIAAGCFLPLSQSSELSKRLGTRHRAALGLAEETDAVVVVVSEETGRISVAVDSTLESGLEIEQLRDRLNELLRVRQVAVTGAA
ncbi:MAG: TIGR00159 family protein [Alphaproteobacteria bacterium CG_4_10_14_0_2_um_filter_63_37]|nr:MAG: TIGR00159 family protein [Proteobacteria bacterium CG1_02_64_396]PJA25934.1 MAG: TIGR00159 family protein [Alphaproteobacteria bacterium CG_4_10_14_0_2_um_filter_63_37]